MKKLEKNKSFGTELIEKSEKVPGLAVVLVGDNPASRVYVKNKQKRQKRLDFNLLNINLTKMSLKKNF